jgi:diguanylate cyclase (GGDEF)-like protein/PAS domain S-box-containing protein
MASMLEARNIERERAEEALNKAYAEMEERVQERTAELTASNSALMVEISERKRVEEAIREHLYFLQTLIDSIPSPIFYKNVEGIYLGCNKALADFLGLPEEEIIGKSVYDVYSKDLADKYSEMDAALFRQPGVQIYDFSMDRGDGTRRDINFHKATYSAADGTLAGLLGVMIDITERKRAEEALRSSKEELAYTVQALEKRNYELTLLNEMGDMLQSCVSTAEAHGVIGNFLQKIFPEDAGTFSVIDAGSKLLKVVVVWGGISITQEVFPKEECWALRTGGILGTSESHTGLCRHPDAPRGVEFLCLPMVAQGDALGVLRVQCGVSNPRMDESKRQMAVTVAEHINLALANLLLRETLQQQSIRDPLTGLYNRRYLEEAMEREIYRAARNQSSLGLIMLDVDHFKQFNDRFGHDAGDELLRELGNFLRAKARQSDIVCRYGGDEFIVIMPGTMAAVAKKAEQLREQFRHLTIVHQGQNLGRATISLGVATYPEYGVTPKALIQTADKALFQAKEEGRDRVVVASVVREEAERATEVWGVAAS